jgi:LEA14-like dessication related protein
MKISLTEEIDKIKRLYTFKKGDRLLTLNEEKEFKQPIFKGVEKIKYQQNGDKHELLITVSVENPSLFNLKIKNYNIKVYLDKSHIGDAEMYDDTIILKKKQINTFTIPLELDINSDSIQKFIISLLKNPKGNHKIELKGQLKGGIFIFNKKIDINIAKTFNMYEIENVNKIIDIVDIGPFNYLKGDIKKVTNKANVIGNKVVDKLGF